MRFLDVFVLLALAGCAAGCCKKSKPRPDVEKKAELAPEPIDPGPEPTWPLPESSQVERLPIRKAGVRGALPDFQDPDPSAPVHGALVPALDGGMRFRTHTAYSVASVGDGSWFLVLARSGLWLLESETMAVRARVSATAGGDVASTVDGTRFAYGRQVGKGWVVEVRSFPSLEVVATVPADPPRRLRFSPSGAYLAVASSLADSATVIDVAAKTGVRIAAGNDVNDAIVLSEKEKWVAFGTDSDVGIIQDWESDEVLFDSGPAMRARSKRGFDQNAMAYDARRDSWLLGGNGDVVWRFDGIRTGRPYYATRTGFANDVEDLLVLPNGDALVALDSGSIDLWPFEGSRTTLVGRSVSLSSRGARMAPQPGDYVLGVLGSVVVRFKPGDDAVQQSRFFRRSLAWRTSYSKTDLLMWTRVSKATHTLALHRVPIEGADPLAVVTRPVGQVAFESNPVEVGALDDGTRLFVGEGTGGGLRVYRVPPDAGPSGPDETGLKYAFGGRLVPADGKRFGYLAGRMAGEIDARGARSFGTLEDLERMRWDAEQGAWQACGYRCRPLGN